MKKTALVCGAGGFIGNHLVQFLKKQDYWVRGVDLHYPEYSPIKADDFVLGDLRSLQTCKKVVDQSFDEVYQLAADMGGAGYIFSGENDAFIMQSSSSINISILEAIREAKAKKVFFSSSACIYPVHNQSNPQKPNCSEDSAYPANPDSDYGWEKLFSERLYLAYYRNYGLDVRIARFHNIFGPESHWTGGRDKFPAAICRKVAEAKNGGEIEIWGDGKQTRSFLYIEDCLEGVSRFMESNFTGPLNIGSGEMITVDGLAKMTMDIAGKKLKLKHVPGPLGVRGRNSDNRLIREKLKWEPSLPLKYGMTKMYTWVKSQVEDDEETKK